MKKILVVAIAVMMIAVMSVTVFAASNKGTIYAVDIVDFSELGNSSPQFKGGEESGRGCLGLGPCDYGDGEFGDAYMNFEVEVKNSGIFTISIRYAAKQSEGQIRCADMIVNDGERIHLNIENTGGWDVWFVTEQEVHLDKGMNIITLKNVEGFDNEVYKAINIDYVAWELKTPDEGEVVVEDEETEAPETEAPETEAPETEAPETEAPETTGAPETEAPSDKGGCGSSVGMAAAIVTITSVLGTAVIRRR